MLNNITFSITEQFRSIVSLFNGISTPYGLFNVKIQLISKCLITMLIAFLKIALFLLSFVCRQL